MWRRESHQRNAPCRSAGSRRFPRSARARRVASKLALGAQTSTRQFPPVAGSSRRRRRGKRLPARLRHCRRLVVPPSRARHSDTISRPGAGRGPVPLVIIVCLVACFRLAVIGRVSPRRATTFLVATRKMDKETPPAAAPALAGALAPPASGGSRRNSPWRAQTSTRQFPPATRSSRRCRRGKRCRLGFAIAGRLSCRVASSGTAFGHDSSPRRRPGSRLFDPCCSVLGLPSVGACWPGLAPKRSALPSCAV